MQGIRLTKNTSNAAGFSIDNNQQLYDKQGKFKLRPASPIVSLQAQKKKDKSEQAEELLSK